MTEKTCAFLSEYLVGALGSEVSLPSEPPNAFTSRCAEPGAEDFGLCFHGEPADVQAKAAAAAMRYGEQQGYTVTDDPGTIAQTLFFRKNGRIVKYVTITRLGGNSYASFSVRTLRDRR